VALLIVSVIGALQWRPFCQYYRRTTMAFLFVNVICALQWRWLLSVIGALQWRYLLSVLKLYCSGVAYCQIAFFASVNS
jgi:hypothetical protein